MQDSEMSPATKEALAKARRMIPPLLPSFHKGMLGRVAVIGGSENYTGAPYFSAMASARLGCDMSHVICTPGAAAVIKTYSPNLMVHPLMYESTPAESHSKPSAESIAKPIIELFPRLHVLVLGPGLGRDPVMQATVSHVIRAAREKSLPMVLDADALLAVSANPALVRGYKQAVLTPNVREFDRLCADLEVSGDGREPSVEDLAHALGGPVIVRKGAADEVCALGRATVRVEARGGTKRSGGQGDTLTGTIATMLAWRHAYMKELWKEDASVGARMEPREMMLAAAVAGCVITRECSRRAFAKKGRSLQASDLTEEVHAAFLTVFPGVDDAVESQ
ncbi:hypothetical protein BROUX41_006376 [Berkeleyomyces rouxiae]